jgi:hypothetical protein
MQVRRIPVSRIRPAAYNPRKSLRPEDPEYQRLLQSMTEFGCVEPLVWNSQTGNLVGGHQRFSIMLAQGAASVDVSVVDLPLEKEKALNIALNKIAGRWDNNKLTALLSELSSGSSLDLGLTGFELPEIDGLLDGLGSRDPADEKFDLAAELANQQPAVTQPGDLIELGRHRLLCGDATKPEILAHLLGDKRAYLLCSDPPYNVDYQASRRPKAKKDQAKHPWHGGKGQSTIWDVRRDRRGHYQHPTQKSLELFERILRNSSRTGDLVLDPFLGSGTTLIAAARLGRTCFGLEIEPKYCDVIVRRFIAAVGVAAVSREVAERYQTAQPAAEVLG